MTSVTTNAIDVVVEPISGRRLLANTHFRLIAIITVDAALLGFADVATAYASLSSQIKSAVNNGSFETSIRSYAATTGLTALANIAVNQSSLDLSMSFAPTTAPATAPVTVTPKSG